MKKSRKAAETAIEIVRASESHLRDALFLLLEYYEAVGVAQRDTKSEIVTLLRDSASGMWIAFVGGAPAGCVVLRPLPAIRAAGECKRLYGRPQFRGLGISGALFDAMEEFARSRPLEWIYLDSKDDLQAALALYRRRGYQRCARYNDNPQATLFMRKELVG